VDPIPFDRIVIAGSSGLPTVYSVEQFFALPLHQRIEHVLRRDVTFFRGNVEVDRAIALRSLRGWSLGFPGR
jgi:hypothetical protein